MFSTLYKPKDLIECLLILLKELPKHSSIRVISEKDLYMYHHTFGRDLRNEWELWNPESDLHKFFLSIGIFHADDMSGIILTSFHRLIKVKPINLAAQVAKYQKYWQNFRKGGEG